MNETIVPLIIATLTPLLVAGIRKLAPEMPKQLLPFFAAGIGPLLDAVAAAAQGVELSPLMAVVYGLAGVGLREAQKQVKQVARGEES